MDTANEVLLVLALVCFLADVVIGLAAPQATLRVRLVALGLAFLTGALLGP